MLSTFFQGYYLKFEPNPFYEGSRKPGNDIGLYLKILYCITLSLQTVLDPDHSRQNVEPDLDLNCLTP